MLESFYDSYDETHNINKELSDIMKGDHHIEENDDDEYYEDNDFSSDKYVDCLNIHQIYFKHLYNKDNEEHMFEDVKLDKDNDTSRSMEFFFDALHTYKTKLESEPEFCDIYDIKHMQNGNINKFNSMYVLKLDDKYHKLSPSLFAIITYIAHYINWKTANWHIISIKDSD